MTRAAEGIAAAAAAVTQAGTADVRFTAVMTTQMAPDAEACSAEASLARSNAIYQRDWEAHQVQLARFDARGADV